ncbi:MAG: P-II family nitrogen regulator [Vampirovibrionales bacterium]|nr:P-II family nitrogen regulator [Vampirovibrionales bacterium]
MPLYNTHEYKKLEVLVNEVQLEHLKSQLDAGQCLVVHITPIKARCSEGGLQLEWRAGTYTIDFLHKFVLTLVVHATMVEKITAQIMAVCQPAEGKAPTLTPIDTGYILISGLETVIPFGV